MLKRLSRAVVVRRLAGRLIGLYLRLALRTTRWSVEAPDEAWPYMLGADGRTAIVAFWHEFLPLIPALWWHAQSANPSLAMTVLISRHRDGRMITEIVQRWGVRAVAGSSERPKPGAAARDKGGAAALRGLLTLLREGSLIAITPDGPRGPRRIIQPGVARLAALSGVPVIAAAVACRPHRRLASWDRMILPLPFGRGRIVCSAPMVVSQRGATAALPKIAAALDDAARRAGADA
jgi:lysophospholipid acyltransferase (LPLAT)-like uncharacterized protein